MKRPTYMQKILPFQVSLDRYLTEQLQIGTACTAFTQFIPINARGPWCGLEARYVTYWRYHREVMLPLIQIQADKFGFAFKPSTPVQVRLKRGYVMLWQRTNKKGRPKKDALISVRCRFSINGVSGYKKKERHQMLEDYNGRQVTDALKETLFGGA